MSIEKQSNNSERFIRLLSIFSIVIFVFTILSFFTILSKMRSYESLNETLKETPLWQASFQWELQNIRDKTDRLSQEIKNLPMPSEQKLSEAIAENLEGSIRLILGVTQKNQKKLEELNKKLAETKENLNKR